MEQASGQPYASFLTEQVLVPLGLTSSHLGQLLRRAVPPVGTRRGTSILQVHYALGIILLVLFFWLFWRLIFGIQG